MATTMNQCLLLVVSNGPIKSIPHFSKGSKGGMGCKRPFIIDRLLCINLTYIITFAIITGILEEGRPVIIYLQKISIMIWFAKWPL
jgi:hypothetical protein